MRTGRVLLLCLLCLSFFGPPVDAEAVPPTGSTALLPAWAGPLQPPAPGVVGLALARVLAESAPKDTLRVIVVLRQQAVPEQVVLGAAGRTEARVQLVTALRSLSDRTQAPLRAYLDGAQAAGLVESYTPFWVFNGLAVRARPSVVRALAGDPAVAAIRLDRYRRWLATPPSTQLTTHPLIHPLASSPPEWNVTRVRAPEVWSSLHISGTGAVVAGMDTGVDWLHPALQANYRGYNPHGSHNHVGNWYDAVGGSLYPLDDHGHGTHTAGTAVGRGGIGVAPGAQWIGVKVLNGAGYGYDSWIHAGFQWLLAPGGDPGKAPDVVNCSWSSSNGNLTTFRADLRALRAAGILPVFANGNYGPAAESVGSPASLAEAFAVGAVDSYDEVASFSSRGPSPWGEVRPHVAAPGVNVRSSLPGGLYGVNNGTSMAAPHVAGIAALLRSVSPTLSITRAAFIITSTAVPLGDPIPNNDTGWGRVDGFAAVAALANPGFISGTVTQAGSGAPIAGATVAATPQGGGGGGTATSDGNGGYALALAPTTYDVTGSAFGYEPATALGVVVVTGATTVQDLALTALPTGTLRGEVTDSATGQPITAAVAVLGTPLETAGSAYTFTLPAGVYTLRARRLGYRVVTATAVVTAVDVATVNLALPPAPSVLLVDSGGWDYKSQVGYFRQALDDLAYAYDEWPIRHLPDDVPAASDLTPYDMVIWSAPWDSPGYIGADGAITGYLSAGGRLLLSGQDIGYLDGDVIGYASYYQEYLKARYVRDHAGTWTLKGVPGDLFAGLTITIAGPGGADNQGYPDEIDTADPDSAAPVFSYQGDGYGGIRAGTCLDYRVIYLSFGFEAINDRLARREVMSRSVGWLADDPLAVGLELTPDAQTHIGPPGTVVTHTARLRHVGQAGSTDVFSLTLEGATWASELQTPLSLAPCTSATVVLTVTVPITAGWDERDVVTMTARSSLSPTLVRTAVITTKAPAPILLVDDDRWYEQKEKYFTATTGAALPYDFWQIALPTGGGPDLSPSLERLRWYPIVVWWTGYDWYDPVTDGEEATLAAYLGSGGRLFLSSQDYAYYHQDSPFGRDYLGMLDYTEGVTLDLIQGVPEDPVGEGLGPWEMAFPFPYGPVGGPDVVEPAPGVGVVFRSQERRGVALARRGRGHATVFFPFPFEALPQEVRPAVMERVVGWLSWLGGSTFAADRGAVTAGGALTYTTALHNDGPVTITASLSNTLPPSLTLDAASLTGPAVYTPALRLISWEGPLGPEAGVTVSYRVTVATGVPAGLPITNTARLGLEDQYIHFPRLAVVRVGAPDLSTSALWSAPSPARPGSVVTCTLALANTGPADAPTATVSNPLPADVAFVPGSLAWSEGLAEELAGAVRWGGVLSAGRRVTVTYRLTLPVNPVHPPLYGVAFLEDGAGGVWERPTWFLLEPHRFYLPLVTR